MIDFAEAPLARVSDLVRRGWMSSFAHRRSHVAPTTSGFRSVAPDARCAIEEAHRLVVNGARVEVDASGLRSLAEVLRDQLRLTGTKIACGRGECGACTVLIGGMPRMACTTPAVLVGEPVETIEGLAAESTKLRARFADSGAFQCGFCTPGQVVHAVALLRGGLTALEPAARRDLVRHALSGNICRCTGYQAIVDAVCGTTDEGPA
jgi:aerobic-type carbon monoxide dehydrogenase small subunit (CoxS/CutS family)